MLGAYQHSIVWRGSRREVDLVFGNVRDAGWLSEDHFRARPGTWRVVIDHPFDDAGHSTVEDLARLDRMTEGGFTSQTIVWLPFFLSEDRMRDVRRLVVLDWLLGGSGERWSSHADHLSETDRVQARAILETQRSALREGLRRAVQECYGAAAKSPGTLAPDAAHDRILVSLYPGFAPAAPVGADLGAAFANLLDQAFGSRHPAHPRFEPRDVEVTVRNLAAVYEHVERAVADPDGRVPLEGDIPGVRRVATALGVGTVGETHFVFGDDRFSPWGAEFERAAGRDGLKPHDPVTAGRVHGWIAALRPEYGLRTEVADLVVLAWAALRQRAWFHHGSPIPPPRPGTVRPEMELRTQRLPEQAHWTDAVPRAGALFGVLGNPHLTAHAVAELAGKVRAEAGAGYDAAAAAVSELENAYRRLEAPLDEPTGRLATARAAVALLDRLRKAPDQVRLVTVLASAELPASDPAVSSSIRSAHLVTGALSAFRWQWLQPLRDGAAVEDSRGRQARAILADLRRSVTSDQLVIALPRALQVSEDDIAAWLAGPPQPPAPPPPRAPSPSTRAAGRAVRERGAPAEPLLDAVRGFLGDHADQDVVVEWRVAE
jgi:hypothetical protein